MQQMTKYNGLFGKVVQFTYDMSTAQRFLVYFTKRGMAFVPKTVISGLCMLSIEVFFQDFHFFFIKKHFQFQRVLLLCLLSSSHYFIPSQSISIHLNP